MEIKKTKFVRKSLLTKFKLFKRSRVRKLRQDKFKKMKKIGNSTVIIHSELMRLTSEEIGKWFEEEAEKGNPIVLDIKRAIRDVYLNRMQRGEVKER